MRLGDVHSDMERYLAEDCYCPNEIYGIDGFFYQLFPPETEVLAVETNDDMSVVVDATPDVKRPQCIIFWHDDGTGRILNAQRVDATENNVGILRGIARGAKPDGRKLDEFEPGSTAKALGEVFSIADAVMID